jgi:hypothetical protein
MIRFVSASILLSYVIAVPLAAQSALTVSDPRPLMALIDKLQATLGTGINYEDPPFEHLGDLEDVTEKVVKNRSAFTGRVIIPKGGELQIQAPFLSRGASSAVVRNSLSDAIGTSERNGHPGRFRVSEIGGVWVVEPVAVRDSGGSLKPTASVLVTRIRMAYQQRNCAEALQQILDQVAAATGFKVVLGMVPVGSLANATVLLGADDEPAVQVLAKLFDQVFPRGELGATWAYRLLFEPGRRVYVFNLILVAADSESPSRNTLPTQPYGTGQRGIRTSNSQASGSKP